MGRAVGTFRVAGLDVIPSPTDYRAVEPSPPLDLLNYLPDAGALEQTSGVMREVIGVLFYRGRGWME